MPSLPTIAVAVVAAMLSTTRANAAEPACDRLDIALASGLTRAIVDRDWFSGARPASANAVLELRGCHGELLDRLTLASPFARLDTTPLRGTAAPTWLVSADLSAPIGSYSGPLTLPVAVVAHRLKIAEAVDASGRRAPIHLATTGKADWRKVAAGAVDDLLSVGTQPERDGEFSVTYRHFHPTPHGWAVASRTTRGYRDAESAFPAASSFPPVR